MKLKWLLGVVIVCAVVFLTGCPYSADVWVDNQDPDGWAIVATLDGQSKTVYVGNPLLYVVSWTGFFSTSHSMSCSATYVSHGGYLSASYDIEDGGEYTWTVFFVPGYYDVAGSIKGEINDGKSNSLGLRAP